MKTLLLCIGLVFVLEGLPYMANPEAMRHWLKKLSELPAEELRILGAALMAVGFFICFVVQKTGLF